MADRRVVFTITVKVTADVEEGISINNVVNNLDYNVTHPGEEATVYDTEIIDLNIIYSK